MVQERLDGKLVVCYQNQIVPTQEAPPRPGVLRTLNATRGLGSVTVENLAAGMDTNGIGGHEREGLGAMTAIGRGLAAGRLTTDRESEAVHPKAQPPRPPTPRQRARWKAVQRAKRRGLSLRAIARELGISRITVRKYVEASSSTCLSGQGDRCSLLIMWNRLRSITTGLWVSGQSRQGCPFIRGLLRSDRVTITATHGVTRSWRWGLSQSSNWITIGLTQQPLT